MTRNDVEFAAYSGAATSMEGISTQTRSAVTTLVSGLQGSLGGSGGTDEAGREWAQHFDEAVKSAMQASANTINTMGNRAELLHATGLNHVKADASSTIGGGDDSFPSAPSVASFAAPSVPSADGGPNQAPMGGMVGKIWSWVEDQVGFVWPNGDPGKLRSVESALNQAAGAIDGAKGGIGSAKGLVGAQQAPEVALVLAKLDADETDVSDLTSGLRGLGGSAGEHAKNIEDAHKALIDAIEEFAIETAAFEVAGALVSIFTAGLGEVAANAAVLARLANLVRKLKELYEAFKTAVRAALVAVKQVAERLGTKFARLLATGGKAGEEVAAEAGQVGKVGVNAARGARGEGEAAARDGVKCDRDPVDIATGDVVLPQTDVDLPGVLPLRLTRTHVSSYRSGRSFGESWCSTLDQRLEIDHLGVVAVGEDGAVQTYPHPLADGTAVAAKRGNAWRLAITDGQYQLVEPISGLKKLFGPASGAPAPDQPAALLPLRSITDQHGNTITFKRAEDGIPVEVAHSGGYRVLVATAEGRVTGLSLASTAAMSAAQATPIASFEHENGRLVSVRNTAPGELSFTYDHAGRLASWTDRNQVRFDYRYDERGRCSEQRSTRGALASEFAYRELSDGGRETAITDSLGGETVYRMDERLRVVEETDQLGRTTTTEFDNRDRIISVVDQTGARTVYERDHTDEITAVIRPDGARTEYEYHSPGRPSRITYPDGSTQLYDYDQRGLLVKETDPAGGTKTYTRDARGAVTAVTDPLGRTTRFQANAAGLPVSRTGPDGSTTRFEHDPFGRVSKTVDPTGAATLLAWTPEGKLASRTSPDGGIERWVHDGEGNLKEHITVTGGVTRYEHGEFDKPVAVVDPTGATTRYEWDSELRLTAVTNPQGLRWEYRHDPAGQLTSETDFNGRVLAHTYDQAGRRASKTSVKTGQSIRYEYDLLGNLLSETTSDGETTRYTYDALGRALSAVNQDATVEFRRDQLGRVVAETINGRTTRWGFNAAGQRTERVTPSGIRTEWAYDPAGLLHQVTTNGQATILERDQHGRVKHTWHSNDLVTVNEYDPAGRLASQGVWAGVAAQPGSSRRPVARTYGYDPAGQLASVHDNLRGETRYLRDQAQRVTHVQHHQWEERYAYDPAGNITVSNAPEELGGGTLAHAGALPTKAGNREYEYDPDGRLIQTFIRRLDRKPDVWRYQWDTNDRLRYVVTPDGSVWKYSYDAYGRRTAKEQRAPDLTTTLSMTFFAWEGDKLIEAVQQSSPSDAETLTWVYESRGTGFTPSTQTRTLVQNQQQIDQRFYAIVTDLVGTPTELLDITTGEVAGWQRQTLWGSTTWSGSASTPLRFAGQYHDPETGFHYNRHRHYNPHTGQFLTTDPLGLAPAPNPRAYTGDPTKWIDPLGLMQCHGDTEGERYGPMNKGPLGEQEASSFRSSSYTEVTTNEPTTLYRVYSEGTGRELGPYWTRVEPGGPLQSQLDSALNPAWGNQANAVSRIQVPPGTTFYEGIAAEQPISGGTKFLGGGGQIFFNTKVSPEWLMK